MIEVKFYDKIEDDLLKFAVIVSQSNGKWVYCKHKERDTYEVPGGHREPDEAILKTAERELYEETGAVDYDIKPVCVYSVIKDIDGKKDESFGMLYYAEIHRFGQLPDYEMEKVIVTSDLPKRWTYPLIQPKLINKIQQFVNI